MAKEVKMYDEVHGLIFDDWGIYYNKQERRNSMWLKPEGKEPIRVADIYKLPDFLRIVRTKMQDEVLETSKIVVCFGVGALAATFIYTLVLIAIEVL